MKRLLLSVILMLGMTATNSLAQMGQDHMSGQGMMGGPGYSEEKDYNRYPYPMMGYGMGRGMMGYGMGSGMMGYGMGPGMMGPGMMGYGMGPGGCEMMGQRQMMPGGYGGYGMGPGMDQGGWGYNAEAYQKFMDETKELRKEQHNKKFEYMEAVRNPKVTREEIYNMEKELNDIQRKIYEKWQR